MTKPSARPTPAPPAARSVISRSTSSPSLKVNSDGTVLLCLGVSGWNRMWSAVESRSKHYLPRLACCHKPQLYLRSIFVSRTGVGTRGTGPITTYWAPASSDLNILYFSVDRPPHEELTCRPSPVGGD